MVGTTQGPWPAMVIGRPSPCSQSWDEGYLGVCQAQTRRVNYAERFFERQLSELLIHAVFVVVSKSTFEIYVRMAPDWLGDFQLPKSQRWNAGRFPLVRRPKGFAAPPL